MDSNPESTLTISQVADRTGVNPVTLRAWQRRYGLLSPARTPKGHRLYSDEDVAMIGRILRWLDKGVPISKVKPLLSQTETQIDSEDDTLARELMKLIHDLSLKKLGQHVETLLKEYPFYWLIEHVFTPLDTWLDEEQSAISSLQKDMWRSTVIEKCQAAMLANAKRNSKFSCWLVTLTDTEDYQRTMMAMRLNEKGYNVTILREPHSQLGLILEVMREQKIPTLAVMAAHRLDRSQLNQLRQCYAQSDIHIVSQPFICSVHGDELKELKENNPLCI
ncbi:MerR family transcriptional regulator [Salinivibrio proteolyticus]|uniref:MerR family transcriptional regulator n=1 Tax=Salinivibrio proteolyticus TaxID=334715 RepID=A0ABY7LIJ5_9GAMM|nr:MerR family transcriptional regulator [Salinivibrio proteolyticus]WBA16256.1 MerR family transcriptional regulator [Salinivibrio proteolyticus]